MSDKLQYAAESLLRVNDKMEASGGEIACFRRQ